MCYFIISFSPGALITHTTAEAKVNCRLPNEIKWNRVFVHFMFIQSKELVCLSNVLLPFLNFLLFSTFEPSMRIIWKWDSVYAKQIPENATKLIHSLRWWGCFRGVHFWFQGWIFRLGVCSVPVPSLRKLEVPLVCLASPLALLSWWCISFAVGLQRELPWPAL